MAFGIKKLHLVDETPIQYLPNISQELGIEMYIKRDDLTPFGAGGNKLRKLEYLVQDALDRGATMLITVGGAQTNHGRLTAAVAAKYGLKCAIIAIDDYPGEVSANILLDRMLDCDLILKADDGRDEDEQFDELCPQIIKEYEEKGERVYFIPMGGSNELGALGYYDCALELDRQAKEIGIEDARVIESVGSMGTYMGLYCGLKNEGSSLRLTGISISPFGSRKDRRIVEYFGQMKEKYDLAIGVVCSKRLLNQAVGKSLRTHNLKPKKGAQVMRKNEKITALYERLSRDDFGKDDDQQRESNSISNQKAMLEEFAARQGFTNIVHFTDDGI
ncbi:MAG: pyridoxal-phosphate dependent enzyme, partial [Anaerovoracaceae bacterium]